MSKSFSVLLGAALLALAGIANAGEWVYTKNVTSVAGGYRDGIVIIGGFPNSQSCTNSSVRIDAEDADYRAVLTPETAALLSGKKSGCFLSGCRDEGNGTTWPR